jgi:hypothetical protein
MKFFVKKLWKIYLLFIFLFVSCNHKTINFEEYINNNREITVDRIYNIENIKNKTKIIVEKEATHYGVYNNPNEPKPEFHLKYRTEIKLIEFIKIEENIFVKIGTKENRIGWIEAKYIDLYY